MGQDESKQGTARKVFELSKEDAQSFLGELEFATLKLDAAVKALNRASLNENAAHDISSASKELQRITNSIDHIKGFDLSRLSRELAEQLYSTVLKELNNIDKLLHDSDFGDTLLTINKFEAFPKTLADSLDEAKKSLLAEVVTPLNKALEKSVDEIQSFKRHPELTMAKRERTLLFIQGTLFGSALTIALLVAFRLLGLY